MIFKKISKVLIIIGTILLIYRTKILREDSINLIRSEFIYFLALIFGVIFFIYKNNIKKLIFLKKEVLMALLVFLAAIALATIICFFRYGVSLNQNSFLFFIVLLSLILLFIFTYSYLKEDEKFYRNLVLAFCLPVLIFLPFLISPGLAKNLSPFFGGLLIDSSNRFTGFTANPTDFSSLAIIAFSFLFVIFLSFCYKRKLFPSIIFLLLSLGTGGLIFLSQSKGLIITLIVVVFLSNLLMVLYFKKNKLKIFIYSALGLLLLIFIFFILLAPSIKSQLLSRFFELTDVAQIDRSILWRYYSGLFIENPLGLGVNFIEEFSIKRPVQGDPLPPHSVILDIAMYGGVGALLGLVCLFWAVFKNIKDRFNFKKKSDIYFLGASTALFAIWFASLVEGNPLFNTSSWILLAMSLV